MLRNGTLLLALAIAALLEAATGNANAGVMAFEHTGRGSGTINGVPFSEADFVITGTGHSSAWEHLTLSNGDDLYSLPHSDGMISIDGVGVFSFTTTMRTFVNETAGLIGVLRELTNDVYHGPLDPVFTTWDRSSPLPNIAGSGQLLQWDLAGFSVLTSGGILVFDDSTAVPVSFAATAIPEPATAVGLVVAVFVIASRRQR